MSYNINSPEFTSILSNIYTKARLIDIYDGDTLTCIFSLYNDHYYKFNIRLNNIDTMEIKDSNIENKKKAYEARDRILSLCCDNMLEKECSRKDIKNFLENNEIYIWVRCFNFDKYGRILADVYLTNKSKKSLSDILIEEKLANKYNGDKKLRKIEVV